MYHNNKEFWAAADKMIEESEVVIDRPKKHSASEIPRAYLPCGLWLS